MDGERVSVLAQRQTGRSRRVRARREAGTTARAQPRSSGRPPSGALLRASPCAVLAQGWLRRDEDADRDLKTWQGEKQLACDEMCNNIRGRQAQRRCFISLYYFAHVVGDSGSSAAQHMLISWSSGLSAPEVDRVDLALDTLCSHVPMIFSVRRPARHSRLGAEFAVPSSKPFTNNFKRVYVSASIP